jgi:hypothetical protein
MFFKFHAALKAPRGEPHKGEAVAVLRVDIGLHLEHETGDPRVIGQALRNLPAARCADLDFRGTASQCGSSSEPKQPGRHLGV